MVRRMLHAPVSWAWVAVVLAIHLWVETRGGPQGLNGWFRTFGLSREGVMEGRIWQLLSYGLLHGSWWHVAINAWFIALVGSRVEDVVGRPALVRVMVGGVVGGGLCHLWLGSGLLVGLSGACLALLLLFTTLSPQSRMLPIPVSARSLGMGVLLAELILTLMHPALGLPGFSKVGRALVAQGLESWFGIGHACHLGGAVSGCLYGRWILRPRVTLEHLRRERARREAE